MKLWAARDLSGLKLYTTKPIFNTDVNRFEAVDDVAMYVYGDKVFTEVTFENSPQQVEI